MTNFQKDMNSAVDGFVAQITDLARRAAMVTLEAAFSERGGRGGPVVVTAAPGRSVARPRGARGAKRTAEDLDALAGKFVAFVKARPGLRMEQINKELGTTTKDLALPIRKLVSEGVVTAKGNKRSTAYFPGRKAKS